MTPEASSEFSNIEAAKQRAVYYQDHERIIKEFTGEAKRMPFLQEAYAASIGNLLILTAALSTHSDEDLDKVLDLEDILSERHPDSEILLRTANLDLEGQEHLEEALTGEPRLIYPVPSQRARELRWPANTRFAHAIRTISQALKAKNPTKGNPSPTTL